MYTSIDPSSMFQRRKKVVHNIELYGALGLFAATVSSAAARADEARSVPDNPGASPGVQVESRAG